MGFEVSIPFTEKGPGSLEITRHGRIHSLAEAGTLERS